MPSSSSPSMKFWQKGYWDHIIRDEEDLQDHLDYIHYNPVHHQLVDKPEAWTCSSFPYWPGRNAYLALGHAATRQRNLSPRRQDNCHYRQPFSGAILPLGKQSTWPDKGNEQETTLQGKTPLLWPWLYRRLRQFDVMRRRTMKQMRRQMQYLFRWLVGSPVAMLPPAFGDTVPPELRLFVARAEASQHRWALGNSVSTPTLTRSRVSIKKKRASS
jgi:hypothetical protein